MQINRNKQVDVIVCSINGDIDINSSPDVRKTFTELTQDKEKKIVVNLKDVSYVDSSGLATLVEALKKTKNYGGKIKLSNLTDKVKGLFEITKLEKIFDIYDTQEDAMNTFK